MNSIFLDDPNRPGAQRPEDLYERGLRRYDHGGIRRIAFDGFSDPGSPLKQQKGLSPKTTNLTDSSLGFDLVSDGLDPSLRADYERLFASASIHMSGNIQVELSKTAQDVRDLVAAKNLLTNHPHLLEGGRLRMAQSVIRQIERELTKHSKAQETSKGEKKPSSRDPLETELTEITETIENIEQALSSISVDEREEFSGQLGPLIERKLMIEQALLAPIVMKISQAEEVVKKTRSQIEGEVIHFNTLAAQESALQIEIQSASEDISNPADLLLKLKELETIQSGITEKNNIIYHLENLFFEMKIVLIKIQLFELEWKQKRSKKMEFSDAISVKMKELEKAQRKKTAHEKEHNTQNLKAIGPETYSNLVSLIDQSNFTECLNQLHPYKSDLKNLKSLFDLIIQNKHYYYFNKFIQIIKKLTENDLGTQNKIAQLINASLSSHILKLVITGDRVAITSVLTGLRSNILVIPYQSWSSAFTALHNTSEYPIDQIMGLLNRFFESIVESGIYVQKTDTFINNVIYAIFKNSIESQKFDFSKAILFHFSPLMNKYLDLKNLIIYLIICQKKPLPFPFFPHDFFDQLLLPEQGVLFHKTHFELSLLILIEDYNLFFSIIQNEAVVGSLNPQIVQIILYLIARKPNPSIIIPFLNFIQKNTHLFDRDVEEYLYFLFQNKRVGYQALVDSLSIEFCKNQNLINFINQVRSEPPNQPSQQPILELPQPPILSIVHSGNFPAFIVLLKISRQLFDDPDTLESIFAHENWCHFFAILSLNGSEITKTRIREMVKRNPNDHREIELANAIELTNKKMEEVQRQFPYYFPNEISKAAQQSKQKQAESIEEGSLDFLLSLDQERLRDWISKNLDRSMQSILQVEFFNEMITRSDWDTLDLIITRISEDLTLELFNFENLMSTICSNRTIFVAFYFRAKETKNWSTILKILGIIDPDHLKDFLDSVHLGFKDSIFKEVVNELLQQSDVDLIGQLIDYINIDEQKFYLSMKFNEIPLAMIIGTEDDIDLWFNQ